MTSLIPLYEAKVNLDPSTNVSIPEDTMMKADANRFDVLGYFKYDCDLKIELKNFVAHIQKIISYVREAQQNEAYMGTDLAYLTFIHRIYGPGYVAILPIQELDHEQIITYSLEKYGLVNKDIFRLEDTVSSVYKQMISTPGHTLKNVHFGLPYQELFGGWKYITNGDYDYYHYDQEGISDRGWGHTYRALQTVISWYKNDRYIDYVPTVRELQRVLVHAHEKKPDFEGAEEGIGAYEVGVILKKLLDVTSKVLYIGNGRLVPEQANELKAHFRDEGTPVLIGGGPRAFVLVGIDHNEAKDQTRFLILNPQYQGDENVQNIQEQEYVSWKESTFFLRDAFYNFCLPKSKYISTEKKVKSSGF